MGQQPVIYQWVWLPLPPYCGRIVSQQGTEEDERVRNFIFLVTDMLKINSFGCHSKGS